MQNVCVIFSSGIKQGAKTKISTKIKFIKLLASSHIPFPVWLLQIFQFLLRKSFDIPFLGKEINIISFTSFYI